MKCKVILDHEARGLTDRGFWDFAVLPRIGETVELPGTEARESRHTVLHIRHKVSSDGGPSVTVVLSALPVFA